MSSTNTNNIITSFTPGDLVVSITGDVPGMTGAYDNGATPIELEELTTTGQVVGYMLLPQTTTTVNGVTEYAISGEWGSSSEGTLQLSGDGQSLVIAGYAINAATYNTGGAAVYGAAVAGGFPNQSALAQSTSVPGGQYTAIARVIADVSYNGTVDTSTALFNVFNLNNPRSVTTINGSTFYISGQGNKDATQGVFSAEDGATSATAIDTQTDTRDAEIINGQLYISYDSKQAGGGGIEDFGSDPTYTTTTSTLTGLGPSVTLNGSNGNAINGSSGTVNLSPENFFFANSTTLYVADGGQPKEGGLGDGGLQKWSLVNGSWQLDYTLTQGLGLVANGTSGNTDGSAGLIGMTATDNSDGTVTFYVTNSGIADLDQTSLYTITDTLADTTASQASSETFTTLLTAADGSNGSATVNIRGIAFAPTAPSAAPTPLVVSAGATSSGLTVSSGGTLTVQSGGVVSSATILSGGIAYISGTDSGTYVAEGGQEVVSGGASYDTIYGEQVVVAGAAVSSETLFNNGGLAVEGGVASAITVSTGGSVVVSGGGTVSGLTISGGTVYLDTAADTLAGTVSFVSGGEIIVSGGGTGAGVISGFTVGDAINVANVGSGATLTSATNGGNTVVTVTSGATSDSFTFGGTYASGYFELTGDPLLTVNEAVADPVITVSSGVTSTGLDILSGQTLEVLSGGVVSNTIIQSGGSAVISGTDSGTSVLSGGVVVVSGTEVNATVSAGGSLTVGGVYTVVSGTTTSTYTVGSGSGITVLSGGSAIIIGTDSGSVVSAGGTEVVSGAASGDTVYGTQVVSGQAVPGSVSSETVFGTLDVITTGATADDITVDGGTIFLSKAVIVTDLTVSGGNIVTNSPKTELAGSLYLLGSNTITIETANSAGYGDLAVISGFTSADVIDITAIGPSNTDVLSTTYSGGNTSVTVTSGGSSESFIFAGSGTYGLTPDGNGGVEVVSGAGTIFQPQNYTVSGGQTSTGLVVSSGFAVTVLSGGTLISASILSSGGATISSGGTDSGTVISAGATETLIGTATGDTIYGTQNIATSTGVIGNETVMSGGVVSVGVAGVTVSGITVNSGGTLIENGNIYASNTVLSGGTLNLASKKASLSGTLTFAGSGGVLQETAVISGGFGDLATINGFVKGDIVDLDFSSKSSVTSGVVVSGGNTVVTVTSGSTSEAFVFGGTYSNGFFALGKDASGNVEITATAAIPCFATGTRLLGINGDILVEDVKPGDELITVRENGPVSRKVVWTGRRAVNLARHPDPEAVRPVRIIAGAFGPGLPERDLRLSPDHALYVDGNLFTAISLVNHTTIFQEQTTSHVTYHHIELDEHDILLAEGMPAESFLDTGNRDMFDNVSGLTVLHPNFAAQPDANFCAPVIRDGEPLATLRDSLAKRGASLPGLKRA